MNNDSNIAHIGVPTRSLSYRIGPAKYKLRFDDNALYVTMEIASRSRTTTHGLLTLSPSFVLDSTLPKNTAERIRAGLFWLGAAVVVYFSDFQSQIPLLAPFLAMFGLFRLLAAVSFFFYGQRTVILSNSGEYLEEIPHDLVVSDDERKEFLASLEAAIKAHHDEWRRRIIT